jgi:Fur family ferric uptake transcriptional regulator
VTTAPERRPLSFAGVEEILAKLRDAGHRVSAPAALVIDALFAADGPVSAEDLVNASPGLERTSVYRNLERLEALGVVSHVHAGHGPGLYALVRGADREYLTCDRCGRVTTVDPSALDGVRAALHADFGHHARFSHFPIHGTCGSCADSEEHHEHGTHAHPHTHTHTH